MRNPYWLMRRCFKRLVIWLGLGAVLTEYCRVCGRRQPLVWHAPDRLWCIVNTSVHGVLCPECFNRLAQEEGHWLEWTCRDD